MFRCSLWLRAAQTGRKKEYNPEAGLLVDHRTGKQVSCSSPSRFLLSAFQPAALSGRLRRRKYASWILSAGLILSGSLLHVPARHGGKGRGGGSRRRMAGGLGWCCVCGI